MSGYGGQPPAGGHEPYGPYGQQQPAGWQDPHAQQSGWQDPYAQQSGWQDPYAQQSGWQDPYAQQSGWQQPPGHGYGPPGVPPSGTTNGSAIGALICNCVALIGIFFCCLGAVASLPGAILAGMAMNRTQSNPESARQLTLWSWGCFGLSIVLSIGLIVVVYVLNVSTPSYY